MKPYGYFRKICYEFVPATARYRDEDITEMIGIRKDPSGFSDACICHAFWQVT